MNESPTPASFFRTVLSALALTVVSDFLLWSAIPRLSWGLFILACMAAVLLNRPRAAISRTSLFLCAALLLTAAQGAVEISFSNVLVSMTLLAWLVGETSYPSLSPGWERVSEAAWALAKAPGRWLWYAAQAGKLASAKEGYTAGLIKTARISLPAILLCGIFAGIFGTGNAILGEWISRSFSAFWQWLTSLDLSLPHTLLFLVLATVSLALLNPSAPPAQKRLWSHTVPRIICADQSIAWWRSVLILAALNGIFFLVNTIDALFLWFSVKLPAGVTHSQYVHEGVNSLIAGTLLSAAVLTALFQQEETVSQTKLVKRLAYVWIGQNVILIAGVLLRLVRYIHACQLTLPRFYAISFVLLVAFGFALLALHIARNRTLNWLLWSNALATLGLFFVMQFLNVSGWVAQYNVSRWERHVNKTVDVNYLIRLGPPAWTSLAKVAASTQPEAADARRWLLELKRAYKPFTPKDWRAWQARNEAAVAWLQKWQ